MSRVAEIQLDELRLLRLVSARVRTRVMIDVGAHQGITLEPFLAAGFDVYAFEPIEANRVRLRERMGEPANLVLRPEAVSRESGTAQLHLAVHDDGSQHDHYHSIELIGSDKHHRKGESVPVPTVRLDELAASGEIPRSVGVLKIDTEGHDLAVLEGASALSCEVVTVEFWGPEHPLGPCPSPLDRVVELMSRRGFGSLIVVEHLRCTTKFRFGSPDQTDAEAWGNVLFFHRRNEKLYEEVADWCRRRETRKPTVLEDLFLRLFPGRSGLRFLDIGAFRGDFAVEILQAFPASTGTLFEPSGENARSIEERLGDDPRVELHRVALSDAEQEREFIFFPTAPATGSLLEPLTSSERPEHRRVAATTIDRVWEQAGEVDVDLIKIGAQGEDLRVLKAGQRMLSAQRPVLVVEAIFVPLYSGQAPAHELLTFAAERGYRLARILNVHHTRAGELAFADLVFVHESVLAVDSEPPFAAWDAADVTGLREELRAAREALRAKRRKVQQLVRQRDALRSRLEAKEEMLARISKGTERRE